MLVKPQQSYPLLHLSRWPFNHLIYMHKKVLHKWRQSLQTSLTRGKPVNMGCLTVSYRAAVALALDGRLSCPGGAASRFRRWSAWLLLPPRWGNTPLWSPESWFSERKSYGWLFCLFRTFIKNPLRKNKTMHGCSYCHAVRWCVFQPVENRCINSIHEIVHGNHTKPTIILVWLIPTVLGSSARSFTQP